MIIIYFISNGRELLNFEPISLVKMCERVVTYELIVLIYLTAWLLNDELSGVIQVFETLDYA